MAAFIHSVCPSFMTAWRVRSDWSQISAGSATVAKGKHAITFSLNAKPGPPDQEAVEKGGEGLPLGSPKGTGNEVAVVRGGYRGSAVVLGR